MMVLEDKITPRLKVNFTVCVFKTVLLFINIKETHFNEKEKPNHSNMTKAGIKGTMQSGWQLEIELGSEISDIIYNPWKKRK